MAKDSLHKDSHSVTGERSWHMDNFMLEEHDVDKAPFRNFPGVDCRDYYDMEDIRNGDWSGSTDTDYESHDHKYEEKTKDGSRSPGSEGRYSSVNQKHGHNHMTFKTSSKRMGDKLNAKPVGIKDPLMRGKVRKGPGRGRD